MSPVVRLMPVWTPTAAPSGGGASAMTVVPVGG